MLLWVKEMRMKIPNLYLMLVSCSLIVKGQRARCLTNDV